MPLFRRCRLAPFAILTSFEALSAARSSSALAPFPLRVSSGRECTQHRIRDVKRHDISTGLASSVSSSRKATQARSRQATQTLTVREGQHRRLNNPRRNQTKRHRKAKSRALSKQTPCMCVRVLPSWYAWMLSVAFNLAAMSCHCCMHCDHCSLRYRCPPRGAVILALTGLCPRQQ